MIFNIILISLTSFSISFLLIKNLKPFFLKYIVDTPNERSSHLHQIPRGLGLIFSLISTIFIYFLGFPQIIFCIPLSICGFLDDIFYLPAFSKYIVQLIVAYLLFFNSPLEFFISNYLGAGFYYISLFFVFISFTAIVNAINFMDGLDGLISGSFIFISLGCLLILDLPLYPLTFSLIAFILFNWHPAKVFMGDSGSLFLGGFYGLSIFQCDQLEKLVAILLIGSPLWLDSFICIIRRFFNGDNIFIAHNKHLYQRLYQAGWKHSDVSSLYIIFIIFQIIGYLLNGIPAQIVIFFLIFIMGALLEKFSAKVF